MKHVLLFICLMLAGLNFSYAQERSEDRADDKVSKKTVEKWSVHGDEVQELLNELGIENEVELDFDENDEVEIIRIEKNRDRPEHPIFLFDDEGDFDFDFDVEDFEIDPDMMDHVKQFKFKFDDGDKIQEFKWDGDGDMPEELRESLEQLHEQIDLENLDFQQDDFVLDFDIESPHHDRPLLGVFTEKAEKGVIINDVIPNSGADLAGLNKGDIILKVEGKSISSTQDLVDAIQSHEVGDKVSISLDREGKVQLLEATLGKSDHTKKMHRIKKHLSPHQKMESCMALKSKPRLGVQFQRSSEGPQDHLVIDKVMEGTTAEEAGLKAGDQIISFNEEKVTDHKSLIEALNKVDKGEKISIKVLRDGVEKSLTAEMKSEKRKPFIMKGFGHVKGKNFLDQEGHQSEEDIIIIRKKSGTDLSIEGGEEKEYNLTLYPNPSQGSVKLSFEGDQVPTEIKIYDAQGKEYYNDTLTPQNGKINQVLELNGTPNGAIFVSIKNGDELLTQKLILQN